MVQQMIANQQVISMRDAGVVEEEEQDMGMSL